MKSLFLIFTLLFTTTSFAEDSIEYLKNRITNNPNQFFHNGVDYTEVSSLPDGSTNSRIDKKGVNLLGGFLTNTAGQFIRLYSLYDSNYEFNNFTLTFNFHSPNGASHQFNCHAIDRFNCGTIELVNCSKSDFGYSILSPKKQIFTYNEEKSEQCTRNDPKIDQTNNIKETQIPTKLQEVEEPSSAVDEND